MTIPFDHPVLPSCRNTVVARRVRTIRALNGALMLSLASGAVLAGIVPTLAAGETFVWDGKGNGTGFAHENNWTDITVRGLVPMLDADGYEVHEWLPVFDGDGNPVYAWHQLFDENDQPVLDEEGNEVWFQGEQELEAGPIVFVEGDVLLPGPPDGGQNMLLLSGTPNISSSGRHVNDVDLLGGEFLIRTGSVAVIPGDFFVDGTLTIDDTGILTIRGDDSRGQNVLTAGEAVIDGGTARGTGILRVTGVNSQTHDYDPTMGLTQTGGLVTELTVETPNYTMSGGTLSALVNFGSLFKLSGTGDVTVAAVLTGAPGATMTQSGGTMNGTVAGIKSYTQSGGTMASTLGPISAYTQSGGLMSGTITVDTYNLTGESAVSNGGTINAAQAFNLGPATGTATVAAKLTGSGGIIKTGASTVVLTNTGNDFAGTVDVKAGTLEVVDDALTDGASISIDPNAILKLTANIDTLYMGAMTGTQGDLVKAGTAAVTLGGNVTLGDLWIEAGRLNIGTGTTTNEAIFDSATVAAGSTLYIAANATLTIRVPQHLVNHGTLINDGTVHDDLDNTGTFSNNETYNANVATNSGTINNNTPGLWTGNISSNAGLISNNAGSTWTGDVVTNNGTIENSGTWVGHVLSNVGYIRNYGTWTGRIDMNTYKDIYNRGTSAVWNGDVINNTQIVNIEGAHWNGKVQGNNNVVFNMVNSFWTGAVVANGGGENNLAQIDNYGTWLGAVETNEGMIFNIDGLWTGDILSNTDLIVNNLNDTNTNVLGVNQAVWDGDILTNTGAIFNEHAGIWQGDVHANSGTIINATGSEWTGNVLANAGTITTTGLWTGDITSGGRLKAGGTITGAVVNSGTLALVGDLTVGSVGFGSNAYFDVDLDAAGEGELLTATGAATLDGIVRIKAGSAMTTGDYLTPYVILTAASRTGTFDGVTTDLAFLTPILDYTATTASVTLQRNTQEFNAVGVTGNQQAVAGQVEALGEGNALYDAILWLTPEQAQAAFDQLSGEIYATAEAMAANNATVIGDIALDRVEKAFDGIDARGSASGYAATSGDTDSSSGAGLWTQLYGANGSADGSDETSDADGWIGGVAMGLDGLVGDWRIGLMLDAGTGATNVAALGSSVASTSYGIGLYGGTTWGDTQLALASLYTRHDNASTRNVEFQGFAEELSADYSSTTLQADAKLSHEFDFGAMSLTPYLSAAYINHATDGFSESGGDAALSYDASTAATAVATLGATVGYQMLAGDGMVVTATASLGWRHSFAGSADASLSLAGGGPFVVTGTASQSDVAALAAGLNFDLDDQTALDFAYDAQVGTSSQTHVLTGTWATKF